MDDALGFIRVNLPRYTLAGQLKAMHANGIRWIIHKGGKPREDDVPAGGKLVAGDTDTLLRMLAPRRLIGVQHAALLANPKMRGVRGGTRLDFRRVWDAIHSEGAILWELYTNRRSDKANDREAIALDAVDALARGRHKTRHTDKRGRPKKAFSDEAWRIGKSRWESRRIKSYTQVQKGLIEGMKTRDLWLKYGPRDDDETEPD